MESLQEILAPTGDPIIHEQKVGTGDNYTETQDDGSIIRYGNATTWDDLVGSLISRRLTSVSGRLDYDFDENAIVMQNNGDPTNNADRLIFNYQKPHKAKQNSEFRLHIHWEQDTTNKIEWQIDYRIQINNELKTTAWTTTTANSDDNNVFTYPGTGTFIQITNLAVIDLSAASLSSTIQFRLTRTDTTTGNILAVFVDAHYEIDSDGSRQEFIK